MKKFCEALGTRADLVGNFPSAYSSQTGSAFASLASLESLDNMLLDSEICV